MAPINEAIMKCPRQDLNLHNLSVTTPSKWRVYQFHHMGKSRVQKYIQFTELQKQKLRGFFNTRIIKILCVFSEQVRYKNDQADDG